MTVDECEDRYIFGTPAISLPELAKLSGYTQRYLERQSSNRSWVSRRSDYLISIARTKSERVEKEIEAIGENLTQIAVRHFKAHNKFFRLAEAFGDYQIERLAKAKENGEDLEEFFATIRPFEVKFWSSILDVHTKAEAAATGVKYEIDPNAAIATLTKLGYGVRKQGYLDELERGS